MRVKYKQLYLRQSQVSAHEVSELYGCIPSKRQLRTRIIFSSQLLMLIVSMSPNSCNSAFLPRTRTELKKAADACLKLSPKGDCTNGSRGAIGQWDVSRVADMTNMFANAKSFRGEISKWEVSNARDMFGMFRNAKSFNGHLSRWDVSRVSNMDAMFRGAALFSRKLCGAAWVHSKASKDLMFAGSPGSISRTVCTATSAFSPETREELKNAVDDYFSLCMQQRDCTETPHSPHGPIGEWDVSKVTDMNKLFYNSATIKFSQAFNLDISKWDVSRVTDMNAMFHSASAFEGDLSKWDVSSVKDMQSMFWGASRFNGDISKWDVSSVTDMSFMFTMAASFNGDLSQWDVSNVNKMGFMFCQAKSFDRDISEWDVSRVVSMVHMFSQATSFKQRLSGAAWALSTATQRGMFAKSQGSISQEPVDATQSAFSPESKVQLKTAVDEYLKHTPKADC